MAEKKESIKILIEADDLASFKMEEARKNLEAVRQTQEKELLTLKRQEIELTGGAEALDEFNLKLQGLDEATAKAIARQRQHVLELQNVNQATNSNAQSTKVSAEFLGAFSSALGFPEAGAFAGEIGNLTEKTSQFTGVLDGGGAGALIFKASLIGLAAGGGFAIGKFLGDIIWQTEEWNKKLSDSIELNKSLNAEVLKSEIGRFTDELSLIQSSQSSPADALSRTEETIKAMSSQLGDIENLRKRLEESKKEIDTFDEEANMFEFLTGPSAAKLQRDQIDLEIDGLNKRHEALSALRNENEKRLQLDQKLADSQKKASSSMYLDSLREELELLKATKDEHIAMLVAKNSTPEHADEATSLHQAIEAQRLLNEEKQKGEEAEKRRLEEERKASQKIADLYELELKALEEKRILIEQGATALKAHQLEQRGLSAEQARYIAEQNAALDLQKELANKPRETSSLAGRDQARKEFASLKVFESRTLTRGPSENFSDRIEGHAKKTNDLLVGVNSKLTDTVKAIDDMSRNNPPIRVRGR